MRTAIALVFGALAYAAGQICGWPYGIAVLVVAAVVADYLD